MLLRKVPLRVNLIEEVTTVQVFTVQYNTGYQYESLNTIVQILIDV